MIQQTVSSSPFAPVYQSDLTRTIGVLQQLQILCATQSYDPSLADVIGIVRVMQHTFGEHAQLETVIQTLIGEHLSQQLAARRQQLAARRQQLHIEAVEVLQ